MTAPSLSLIMPYYRNPGMLAEHYRHLVMHVPETIRDMMEVIIVDDGSPEPAADVHILSSVARIVSIYRIKVDKPWNQHGARNLGAAVSRGRTLLLTDMDHVIPADTLAWTIAAVDKHAWMFPRRDAPALNPTVGKDGVTHKPHPNTFAMRRTVWDEVGGYDEDFCGFYGTDSMFRRRLNAVTGIVMAPAHAYIVRYPREVIPDASTTTLDRDAYRRPNERAAVYAKKAREGRQGKPLVMNFEWERVI